ncbi:MAG: glycosyltransferase family 4 protein [Thermoleophilia bacterium]
MKITFVLPVAGVSPMGGSKVVYEYANGLIALGHRVTIIHPALLYSDASFWDKVKKSVRYVQRRVDGSYRPDRWFGLEPNVEVLWVSSLHPRYVPNADVIVSTAWQTAEWIQDYPVVKGKKVYLIYDYEHYMSAAPALQGRIGATFRRGMFKIATSPAVKNMIRRNGVMEDVTITNGIDLLCYCLKTPIESSERVSIGFPSRLEPFKGTVDAINAMEVVRDAYCGVIDIWSFGGPKPNYMPGWVNYHERPTDKALCHYHNRSAIFVVPSHYEGFGLPGAEAMACGAALVSTDNGGVNAYAEHGVTALLSPPREHKVLAANVLTLLRNSDYRIALARSGHAHIQNFSWERAIDAFEQAMKRVVAT